MKRHSKLVPALFVAMGLAACASQEDRTPPSTQDVSQAVQDFVEVRQLEPVGSVKVFSTDNIMKISNEFVLYEKRQATYIMKFDRYCEELDDYKVITPDRRWDLRTLRARYDTIRGCRIENIWGLTDAELTELKNIGDVPGEHS